MKAQQVVAALCRQAPRVIGVIGAGGKTTLVHRLANHLAGEGKRVVVTTTTHFGTDRAGFSPKSPEKLNAKLEEQNPLLCAYPQGHRMTGLPVEWYDGIAAHHIVVEADGSRCLPLKIHRPFEPVLPPNALVVQVAGLSALDRPVRECVHCFAELALDGETPVDEALIARLLLRGFAHAGITDRKIALLNQADTEELVCRGEEIARILEREGVETYVTALREGANCSS